MKKTLTIMVLVGVVSLLALTGCATVAAQTQDNNPTSVSDQTDPIQAPPLEERLIDFPEFLSVVGTISDVEEVTDNVYLVRIFWTETIHGSGEGIAELPMHIYLYIDQDTVILTDSDIEVGMFVTAVYRAPTREQQLTPNETLSAVAISDRSFKVARFDENWMYHNIRLTITEDTEIIFQDGQPFDGEIADLQGRALVTIIGMSATPVPNAENPIHENWPSKIVVLFEQAVPLVPGTASFSYDTPSSWALEQVSTAIALELVPKHLQNNFTQAITRTEFTALAVALYEVATGGEIAGRMEFNDTNDINVQKMGYLGVVTGVGNGNFAPQDTITREQAAVMLSRLANVIGQPLYAESPAFADSNNISDWAFNDVGAMQATGIMTGVGNNRFDPQGQYTREQSIITVLRLFDLLNTE
jgi:hypothetical protein